jgi:hypothetical protein
MGFFDINRFGESYSLFEDGIMEQSKRELLETKGWKVGTVTEFLELTPKEAALVEIKLALSRSSKTK